MFYYSPDVTVFFMLALYLCGALVSLVFYKKHKLSNILSNILSISASLVGIGISAVYLVSGDGSQTTAFSIASAIPHIVFNLHMDRLSAFFILALSLLVLCVSVYSIGYISHYYGKRNVGLFNFMYNLFILSMIAVFLSGNMIFFLIAWEVMSLVSYFLVVFEGEQAETRRAGIVYLVMTHIATAFLVIAFALIYSYSGFLDISAALSPAIPAAIKNIVFVCLLIGFGTKAGMIPLHVWLPYAHPAAPSNISALMSGIMIKTAVYGLIRFVLSLSGFQDSTFQWWGITVLVIGAVSTVLGVAYALMEHNIKRLLAYHSIENIGIILIGTGLSMYGYATGNPALYALSLIAALFHLLNHTLFKGALFLGAGAIHYSTHTKDLEKLGGLLKKMPYTGLFFLVASLSICAIPPFNGFVSEWLTYQSLFMNLGLGPGGMKLVTVLAAAALAMAGALAAACFVKAFGISFLALPRSEEAKDAREVPASMVSGMGLLSALCLAFGIFPLAVIKLLDGIAWGFPQMSLLSYRYSLVDQLQGTSFFVYYPVNVGGSNISPLFAAAAGLLLVLLTVAAVMFIGRKTKERKYGTWDCGFNNGLNARMQYSSTGFSKPLRIVFRAIYRPGRELQIEEGPSNYFPKSMKYVVSTQPIFEKYLYQPIINLFTRFSKKVRMTIQTGSVHTYLIYIFVTIVVLLIYYALN